MSIEDTILEAIEARRSFAVYRGEAKIAQLDPTHGSHWRVWLDGAECHAAVRVESLAVVARPSEEVGVVPRRWMVRLSGDVRGDEWVSVWIVENDPVYTVRVEGGSQ